jgi:hypothetical protein
MKLETLEKLCTKVRPKIYVISYFLDTPELFTGFALNPGREEDYLFVYLQPWRGFSLARNESIYFNASRNSGLRLYPHDKIVTGYKTHRQAVLKHAPQLTPELQEYFRLARRLT